VSLYGVCCGRSGWSIFCVGLVPAWERKIMGRSGVEESVDSHASRVLFFMVQKDVRLGFHARPTPCHHAKGATQALARS
jgi:hypothetical protein